MCIQIFLSRRSYIWLDFFVSKPIVTIFPATGKDFLYERHLKKRSSLKVVRFSSLFYNFGMKPIISIFVIALTATIGAVQGRQDISFI